MAKPGPVVNPSGIDTSKKLEGTFGTFEANIAAVVIIECLVAKGDQWQYLFTRDELEPFIGDQLHRDVNDGLELLEEWMFIIKGADGLYNVTSEFVGKCHG